MTESPQVAPYGTWRSPITTDLITGRRVGVASPRLDGDDVYWIESRPAEAGRSVVVRRRADGTIADAVPAGFSVRTRVHEYGGGAYTVRDGVLIFSNFQDTRLYRIDGAGEPRPITPAGALRYADPIFDPVRSRLIAIREDHSGEGEAVNTIVALDPGGDAQGGVILASGADFYANPRLDPEGTRLAWVQWNHPNMPWDDSELWAADVNEDGSLGEPRRLAGGPQESIFQPEWSPDGVLYFVSDRTGWWNLYRRQPGADSDEAVAPIEAEFGVPQWVFGMRTYAFLDAGTIIATYTREGLWHLATIDLAANALTPIETLYTEIDDPFAADGVAVLVAGSAAIPASVVRYDAAAGAFATLKRSLDVEIDPGYLSEPIPVEFPTGNGQTAHAFLYPPRNRDYVAPEGELPPLLVQSHGGPTGATSTAMNLALQYWTSRGFAVLDVNYGGSTGYGRPYRQRLTDTWGLVDVEDHVNAARHLIAQGLVDRERTAIRGWSASGYTTLAALTFADLFRAGASHFGISDLETMTTDTHKFESRYLDGLIGPYPDRRDIYMERSPIHHLERISAPLILFQGTEDTVVPPDQAEKMYEAMAARGLPVALVMFAGEGHGFRSAENIRRALEGELDFYGQVFGFTPADEIEPVRIANVG
ncbi:MAG: S9 family peptidase [Thermomicrobiales bacterium]|nr:S9 family peptidase [Thermomicrobiales bacterium]